MIDKLKNLIETLKKEEMTRAEKMYMYTNISASKKPIPTPYFSKLSFVHFGRVVGVLLLVFMVGTTGLSFASASALPGDWLYKIKTGLKEKIEDKFVFTSEKRIALHQQRIEVRFSEVKTLIKEKKITSEKLLTVEAKIQEDKEKIGTALEEINKENPEIATVAKTDLEASIQEEKEKIDTLIDESGIEETTGEEINYGEIDLGEDGEIVETPETTTEETPFEPTTTVPTDPSVIQDLKVIPDAETPIIPILEEIDGINADTNQGN